MEDWKLKERTGARRCALCHGDIADEALIRCAGCGTQGHFECFRDELSCPTLGCSSDEFASERLTKPRPRRLGLDGIPALAGLDRPGGAPRIVERRIVRARGLQRVLSFLGLTVDDIVNSRAAKRRVYGFYKVQRASERTGLERQSRTRDAYEQWLREQV